MPLRKKQTKQTPLQPDAEQAAPPQQPQKPQRPINRFYLGISNRFRVAKYIGSYTAAMNGVDTIVFTAGIGENDANVRAEVLSYLGYLGIELDEKANDIHGEEAVISTADSKVKVLVIPTNEELAIARDTVALVSK